MYYQPTYSLACLPPDRTTLGRLELLHALVIKHGFSPEHGFGVAAVLPFVLPLCSLSLIHI